MVYGYPEPEVTWYKDDVELPENQKEGRFLDQDKQLIIQKARRSSKHDDSGVYHFVARNKLGSERSKNAVVRIRCKFKIEYM